MITEKEKKDYSKNLDAYLKSLTSAQKSRYSIILNEIKCFVGGGVNSLFYIGITSNPDSRIFGGHCVARGNRRKVNLMKSVDGVDGSWICCKTYSEDVTRAVELFFLVNGFDGDVGGGTSKDTNNKTDDDKNNMTADMNWVYCFKKTSSTVPELIVSENK